MFYLQLRNELWKLFGKKRTYIGFGMFLVAEIVIILIFRYSNATRWMKRTLENNGFVAEQFLSVLTIASLMVIIISYTLLPLYVALVGGDLVSKEAEDGTLRMILSRPISRLRLLGLKWLAGFLFSMVLVLSLGLFGLLFTNFWFPADGSLFVSLPGERINIFQAGMGLKRYAAAHLFMVTKACTVMGLAFMFSCFNMKPAAATILALSVIIINGILMEIPYFKDLQQWFLTYHLNTWQLLFVEKIPWWKIGESLSILFGFNVSFVVVGCTAFHMRDIKS
ncbi:MAG: ABC transporter permease subunit [Verrucomicrobia bacterium]|nr:ABC transporter permease subunit [Verrucomicrobiota bacterium]